MTVAQPRTKLQTSFRMPRGKKKKKKKKPEVENRNSLSKETKIGGKNGRLGD